MKLESLISQLEQVRVRAEACEFADFGEGYTEKIILQLLLDYIGNPKIEEKVDEICF